MVEKIIVIGVPDSAICEFNPAEAETIAECLGLGGEAIIRVGRSGDPTLRSNQRSARVIEIGDKGTEPYSIDFKLTLDVA